MSLYKIIVKLYTATDAFEPVAFVPVFHRWIQDQELPGHLLIDVADYAHVPDGPGTLLVSSEANLHMDRGEGRLGLMYVRKQRINETARFEETLQSVLGIVLRAAAQLEQDPAFGGQLRFRTDEISVRLNDRLLAPNTPETVADYQPHVTAVAEQLFSGLSPKVEPHNASPLELVDLRITTPDAPSVTDLLARLPA